MIALALAGACLTGTAQHAPAVLLKDPYAIFAAARTHWEIARYPSQLSYAVGISVTKNGIVSEAHYHSYYDSLTNHISVNAVSDEELAHPYTPHGINIVANVLGGSIPLGAPERTFDYLGVPVLAPNYSFGISQYVPHAAGADSAELVAEIRREFCDPPPRGRVLPETGLKTIASIEVARRSYIISLNGIAAIGGHRDYDLSLRPVSDPGRYRLREVWIDAATFATDKLISQGNFANGGVTGVSWTVIFRQVDGTPYLASEHTDQPFELARRSYDSATIAFSDITQKHIPLIMGISDFAVNAQSGVPALVEPSL